ncbi:MAG TPA: serine/threonine-protein kinase [Burkholderiales bacterium]|nr:serine/threonine-protein kinase [Burkholderiales bacterium]
MGEPLQLGRYQLGAEIGRGSTGIVYKARDPIIDRVVAIKTVDFRRLGEQQGEAQDRFFAEAKSAGRLSHPNIVTIYDAGEAQGCAYIAMELLEGCSLREMLDGGHPISVGRGLEITAQIARGLAYAHEHGVVHRDVKPANVILVGSRRAKITDFGIARLNTASSTADRELAGSPKYMSPEQIRGETVDGRSDLFSLGAILYEMLAGKHPFEGDNLPAIMRAVQEEQPPPPSVYNSQIPPDVEMLIARMLAKSPEDRFPSSRALLRELSSLLKKHHLGITGGSLSRDETLARAKRIKEARRRRVSDGEKTVEMTAQPALKAERRKLPMAAFYSMAALSMVVLVGVGFSLRSPNTALPAPVDAQPVAPIAAPVAIAQPTQLQPPTQSSLLPPKLEPTDAQPTQQGVLAEVPTASTTPEKVTKPAGKPRKSAAPAASTGSASTSTSTPAETATVVVAVAPWGEVFVDGQSRGTTPPLSSISLAPGKHRIEIRNGNLTPYAVEINIGAGDTRRIKHKFE